MTDISKEAVERLAKTADLFAKAMKAWQHQTQKHNEDVRDTLRALSARVEELEAPLSGKAILANEAIKSAEQAQREAINKIRLQALDEAAIELRNKYEYRAAQYVEALKEQSND